MTASASCMHCLTNPRSTMDPTSCVNGEVLMSSPIAWCSEFCNVRISASPKCPALPVMSILSAKRFYLPGISHEEFVKHWVEIHAPMARACPGIGRYALTIVKSASTRKDVAPYEIQVDGIAELWFKSQADFEAYSNSPATKRLRDDGATFIGREIDFMTEEQVIIS